MSKRIALFPGVGLHEGKSRKNHSKFVEKVCQQLSNATGKEVEGEVFYWEHAWPLPEITLPWKSVRTWGYEVILDFQQVVKHAFTMEVPEADIYMGCSAGSIIALAQEDKPCVIFGSPAVLVECIHDASARNGTMDDTNERLYGLINSERPILNIINKYDQLAYYIQGDSVENYLYKCSWWKVSTYNPYSAHTDYWTNDKVSDKILDVVQNWI